MKRILVFALAFVCFRGWGQQIPSQVQAKRGVFTDRLFLNDRWIDRITTNLNSADSASDNVLATGNALGSLAGGFIKNQLSVAQSANLKIQGRSVIGSQNSFRNTLTSGFPATANVTQGSGQYGLSIQRYSNDQGPADIVLYKNGNLFFSEPFPIAGGDPIGSIAFSGVAGDNVTLKSPVNVAGYVEKVAPSYLSSGFVFSTTDTNGSEHKTYLNAQGNLVLGNAPILPASNQYKLNVTSGDVGFKSIAASWDYALAGSNNSGVLGKFEQGYGIYLWEGLVDVSISPPRHNYITRSAILSKNGTDAPSTNPTKDGMPDIIWTRDSVGHYTGTTEDGGFYLPFTWLHTNSSDPSGNVGYTRIYVADVGTLKLIVKDNNLVDTDDWTEISIEMHLYISG